MLQKVFVGASYLQAPTHVTGTKVLPEFKPIGHQCKQIAEEDSDGPSLHVMVVPVAASLEIAV